MRGSTPCHGDDVARYGGATSSVSLRSPGHEPVLFDLGTGLQHYTERYGHETFRGSCLLTHLHYDHVLGLPFFKPLMHDDARLDIHVPPEAGVPLAESFRKVVGPPLFPVTLDDIPGEVSLHPVTDGVFELDGAKVTARTVPHPGPTCGFRWERDGVVVVYISDHQQPLDGSFRIVDAVRELADGADLLIHDAQYTPAEFRLKRHWGHSMIEYAVVVAAECRARRLALFHHDPSHDDDQLDALGAAAASCAIAHDVDVFAARAGDVVELG